MSRAKVTVVLSIFLFLLCGPLVVVDGQKIRKSSAPHTSPYSGEEMYKAYCASCHGIDGKGGGPAASALKSNVPDLTSLATRNNGKFPSFHVMEEIRGDVNHASHGSRDMPIWGPVFLAASDRQQAQTQQRIRNLTRHIESLQGK